MQFDSEQARRNMVDCQLKTNGIIDEAIVEAFLTVPRELYVPRHLMDASCRDEDISLPDGGFLMEPLALARLIGGARITNADAVLVLGCCTGYVSALAARLAKSVIALVEDRYKSSVEARFVEQKTANAVVVASDDLASGAASDGPYDVIIIPGGVEELPKALLEQLAPDGRLLTIRRSGRLGHAVRIRYFDGHAHEDILSDTWAPMLDVFAKKPEFVF